ncbi:MAG: TonB family protein [Verrucomicrobiales bacterium]|nr:TonB family protein [Verrucomicrobiales bacterium]
MNRTQKKCLIASAAMHLLLIALLVVGPAFRSPDRLEDARPLIDFVPLKTIDEALAGGGNPQAAPAPPAPPQPSPPPPQPVVQPPVPRSQPTPAPPEPPQPARDPESFELKPATRKAPDIQLTPVVRKPQPKPTSPPRDTQTELARAARTAAQRLQQSLSSATTTVELRGPGGGGLPYANFLDAVKKVYSDAWIVPDDVTDDEATATASVTIARDGSVVSARLVRASGNPLVDASVEAVLRRVTYVVPLPETARENQRTVTIRFNVKAKRALG